MKLIILSLWLVLCTADTSLSMNGGQVPDGIFDDGFAESVGPKVAKQFVTNRHKAPSTYNPCDQKECSPGYSCKAISNQYLLQVSVALCVPNSVIKIAENTPCITILLGGGQMGCKTQAEWEKIGAIQCSVRVTSNMAYNHTTKAHRNCRYDHYKQEHTFLQAEINCCPVDTINSASITPQDDHNENPVNSNSDSDLNEKDSSQKRNRNATVITIASIVFAFLGLALLMVGYHAYRRHHRKLPTKPHPNDGGMSFINHNSDVYEESNFDPNKSLIMYPDGVNNSKDYVVQNPIVSSK